MILHQIEALAAAGVTDIVLAVNYRPEIMEKYLAEVGAPPHGEGEEERDKELRRLPPLHSTRSNSASTSPSRSRANPSGRPAP